MVRTGRLLEVLLEPQHRDRVEGRIRGSRRRDPTSETQNEGQKMYYHPSAAKRARFTKVTSDSSDQAAPATKVVIERPKEGLPVARRILHPNDGSASALRALTHLIRSVDGAPTAEVHVVNVQRLIMQGDFALNIAVRTERRARLAAAEGVLGRAREMLHASGIRCRTTVLFGDPARAIARYAEEYGFDLIVMGTRGLSALNGVLRRSVAASIVGLTDIPVLLVRSARRFAAASGGVGLDALASTR
jgi:nucleotide-binding universal stress UspA family protein